MHSKSLERVDLHRMLASGAKLAAEGARLEAEKLRGIVNQQAAEISFLKAQITMAEAARGAADRIKQAEELCRVAKREHEALSKELTAEYKVDMSTASFDPMTGQIHVEDAPEGVH